MCMLLPLEIMLIILLVILTIGGTVFLLPMLIESIGSMIEKYDNLTRTLKYRKAKINGKKLYCYAKADAMVGHNFKDDVAICTANNLFEACMVFSKMYSSVDKKCIKEVVFNDDGVFICTDY